SLAVAFGFTHPVAVPDVDIARISVVEARDPLRARSALAVGLSSAAHELLVAFPEAELVSTGSELVLSAEEREGALVTLLELAGRAATALESARIKAVSREALARCGFCHGDLVPEERDVRCDLCSATVHASCWETHKGCPALGCKGHAR
ncbi:MAG TPA: hypothetical protein VFF73_40580, partial [Planctomycetota bacterium]|nr:hypothetical protein [Planctomycetota bacterium]